MPSYKNFQNDNNKYTDKSSRNDIHNPAFNSAIAVNSKSQEAGFKRNQKKWADVVAYFR
jgi:hypothetical protein